MKIIWRLLWAAAAVAIAFALFALYHPDGANELVNWVVGHD